MYLLECTVCNIKVRSRRAWNEHLLQDRHQARARQEHGGNSWSKERKCVVVLFGNFPVACPEVLEHLSKVTDDNLVAFVTDFVWWPGRPRVALLWFESGSVLDNVFEAVEGPKVHITSDRMLELRKGAEYLDFEWEHLISSFNLTTGNSRRRATVELETRKRKHNEVNSRIDDRLKEEMKDETMDSNDDSSDDEEKFQDPGKNEDLEFSEDLDDAVLEELSVPDLRHQFLELLHEVAIPEEDFQAAKKLQGDITSVLKRTFPKCQLYMFRHWYLGLKSGSDELLFVVDIFGRLEGNLVCQNVNILPPPNLHQLLSSDDARAAIPGLISLYPLDPHSWRFFHEPSGLQPNLVTSDEYLLEAQTCRLLEFLLQFDPRAKPLLLLVIYCAKLNHSPAALEWLVIFFLSLRRVIPIPRELFGYHRHTPCLLSYGKDIGFSNDPILLEQWARKAESYGFPRPTQDFEGVLELAHDFFRFYSSLANDSYVVNTMDAEIYTRATCRLLRNNKDACGPPKNRWFEYRRKLSKRCKQEIHNESKKWGAFSSFIDSNQDELCILHPLTLGTRFVVNFEDFEKTTVSVKEIAEKLQRFKREDPESRRMTLKKLLKSGKYCFQKEATLRNDVGMSTVVNDIIAEQEQSKRINDPVALLLAERRRMKSSHNDEAKFVFGRRRVNRSQF